MPKYLLLKHYRGGPEPHRPVPPIDRWAPEDVEAHMAFQHHVSELLEENGEFVDAQALAPARTWVRYGGPDAAPVTTDGPHPETGGLVRRGEDFDAAEDALQEALLEALRVWPEHPPGDPQAWLATVATRRLVDARRSEAARHRREEATSAEPPAAATEAGDETLFLLFCCCHPDLAPTSQVALTMRAVGGLTTREIADAFYVPEATMAQRICRAKRALQGRRLDQPGDLAVVLRVLYLVYTAGHAARVDLAAEAIRLARQLTLATDEPEARGLLALMLLNHARLAARVDP